MHEATLVYKTFVSGVTQLLSLSIKLLAQIIDSRCIHAVLIEQFSMWKILISAQERV